MVYIHKTKKMEQPNQKSSSPEPDSPPDSTRQAESGQADVSDSSVKNRKSVVLSPARRPTTRSQTTARSADLASAPAKRSIEEVDPEISEPPKLSKPPREMSSAPSSSTDPSSSQPGQYTFLAASPSVASSERRGPRTRTAQPVPVPNLTKKSRGRRVPTKVPTEKESGQKSGRLYVCKVEDCGKCFNRGEHLKRHVRSIHTHEKPFKCSHPDCDKYFNRHDNLLQHQKVHKDFSSANNDDEPISPMHSNPNPPLRIHHEHVFRGAPLPNINTAITQAYASFPSYHHGPVSPSNGFATNMAVSSLRTELPSLDPPSNDLSPQPRYLRSGYEPQSPLLHQHNFPSGPALRLPAHQAGMEQSSADIFYA